MDAHLRKLERQLGTNHPAYIRALERAGFCVICHGPDSYVRRNTITCVIDAEVTTLPCPVCRPTAYERELKHYFHQVSVIDGEVYNMEGEDVTYNPAWFRYYEGDGYNLALLQDPCGYYWNLRWSDPRNWGEEHLRMGDNIIPEFLGSREDVIQVVGKECDGCSTRLPWDEPDFCKPCEDEEGNDEDEDDENSDESYY